MKIIVDINNKTLKMLENKRPIFKGEYNADKLTLYINKHLRNEYPVITGLLSNGRKIGGYTTDDSYTYEVIDGVEYTVADFTLSKENGYTLTEGVTQVTIWMYKTVNGEVVSKTAIGNITFNVVSTTAYDDGDIIISGDVEGTVVNLKVELENLQSKVENRIGLPIELSSPEEMNAVLQEKNIGKLYKYVGITNDLYINGYIYQVTEGK